MHYAKRVRPLFMRYCFAALSTYVEMKAVHRLQAIPEMCGYITLIGMTLYDPLANSGTAVVASISVRFKENTVDLPLAALTTGAYDSACPLYYADISSNCSWRKIVILLPFSAMMPSSRS